LLDGVVSETSRDSLYWERSPGIEKAARKQQAAFENYLESRMRFFESACDRTGFSPTGGAVKPLKSRALSPLAAVAVVLGATAFNIGYFARAQRQIRDLNVMHAEVGENLNRTRASLERVLRDLAAPGGSRAVSSLIPAERKDSPGHIRLPLGSQRKKAIHASSLRLASYQEFTLTAPQEFTRVGPVSLSLRLRDPGHKYFDIYIIVGNLRFYRRHVGLYQTIRIPLKDPNRSIELGIRHIERNKAQGYFRIHQYDTPALVASHVLGKALGGL
jgi:hypothetical protein